MTVKQRLIESKAKLDKRLFDEGVHLGRQWAEKRAEAEQLELLARDGLANETIMEVADFLDEDSEDLVGEVDPVREHSASYAEGFVTGALVVFAEHFAELV